MKMKGSLLLIFIWIAAFILTRFSDFSLFEAFVVYTLSFIFIRLTEGAAH